MQPFISSNMKSDYRSCMCIQMVFYIQRVATGRFQFLPLILWRWCERSVFKKKGCFFTQATTSMKPANSTPVLLCGSIADSNFQVRHLRFEFARNLINSAERWLPNGNYRVRDRQRVLSLNTTECLTPSFLLATPTPTTTDTSESHF